ncbi:MAG: response regulator [bacterium]
MRIRPSALVIEDDTYALRLIGAVADRAGFMVTSATTGAQAEGYADTLPFDIIVVDLHLPDAEGLTLVEKLRARPQLEEVPFIVCSGDVSVETITGAARLGALEFVKKPIDLVELQRRFERSYDLLNLRWSTPVAKRTADERQSLAEALARTRSHLLSIVELLDPAASPSVAAEPEDTAAAPSFGAADPYGDDDDDAGTDEPEVLTVEDMVATLKMDAAAIGSPRLERLVRNVSDVGADPARRGLLAVAMRVALKALDNRVEN